MFKIEIEDPHLIDQRVLIAAGKFLLELGGHGVTMLGLEDVKKLATKSDQLPLKVTTDTQERNPEECESIENEIPDNFDCGQPTFIGVDMAEPGTDKTVESVIPPDYNPFANANESTCKPEPAFVVPPAPVGGVELDVKGLPWDARIHARTKTKLANGEWKVQRGIDPALVKKVNTELRSAMLIPAAPGTVRAPVATVNDGKLPVNYPQVPPPPPIVPVSSAASSVPPVSSAASVENVETFPSLMAKISSAVNAGKITKQQVAQIVAKTGLPSLALLATRPDLVPQIGAEVEATILGC